MSVKHKISLASIFFIGLLFYGYEFFLRLINGAYETQICSYFNLDSKIDYSFLVSSYSITYLIMQIPCGLILDRFQSRYVVTFAILTCGIGNIIFLYPSYQIAVFGRLLIGFGSAFAFIGVLKISREYFSSKHFSLLTSIAISFGTLAGVFSQQITVLLSNIGVDWKIIFISASLASIPLSLISFFVLAKNRNTEIKCFNEYSLSNYLSLAKNKLIWLNALWSGFIHIPTVILTTQFGVLFFSHIYGFNQYYSVQSITVILFGWVVFSPVMVVLSKYFGIKQTVVFSSFLSLLILSMLTLKLEITSMNIMFVIFIFGCSSASQILVWQSFNKFCKPEFAALGIAMTNMIMTGITEMGQLASGWIMDSSTLIKWFKSSGLIKQAVQINIMIFAFSIIVGIIIFYICEINRQKIATVSL